MNILQYYIFRLRQFRKTLTRGRICQAELCRRISSFPSCPYYTLCKTSSYKTVLGIYDTHICLSTYVLVFTFILQTFHRPTSWNVALRRYLALHNLALRPIILTAYQSATPKPPQHYCPRPLFTHLNARWTSHWNLSNVWWQHTRGTWKKKPEMIVWPFPRSPHSNTMFL